MDRAYYLYRWIVDVVNSIPTTFIRWSHILYMLQQFTW